MKRAALVALALVACGGPTPPAHTPAPAPAPRDISCLEVRQHVEPWLPAQLATTDTDLIGRVAHVFTKRCLDDRWAPAVRACAVDAPTFAAAHQCIPTAEVAAFDAAIERAKPDPNAVSSGGLPQECFAYRAIVEKLAICDQLPQATRDAMLDSLEQGWRAWLQLPDDAKRELREVCREAAQSFTGALQACT